MTRIKQIVVWLPWFITLMIWVCAVGYVVLVWAFGWRNDRVFYWLAYNTVKSYNDLTLTAFILFLVSTILYTCIEIGIRVFKLTSQIHRINAASMFMLFIASLFLCGGGGIVWWQSGITGYREHIDSASLPNHVYHVQFYSADSAEAYSQFYYLYACDSLDVLCESIYSIPRTTGGITPDVETIHLIPDSSNNMMMLEVNGEVVYTHQP